MADETPTMAVECAELTKREYFAAHAPFLIIDALIAMGIPVSTPRPTSRPEVWKTLCRLRYEYADAMLEAGKNDSIADLPST